MDLETIKENETTPPKSRLADAESARGILAPLIKDDESASLKRSKVQGAIDGNPPYSDAELRKKAQGFVPNCNYGGARAKINDALAPHFDLLTSSPCLVSGCVYYGDTAQRGQWASDISERLHRLLFEDWGDDFIFNMLLHQKQLVTHGIGPCIFRNPRDWRFTALKRRAILVPADSPLNSAGMEIVFIRDSMRVHELFKFIENKEAATKVGWKYDATLKAIKDASVESNLNDYEQVQDQFKNNTLGWAYSKSKVIQVAHAYVTEFDGRVSHHIFTETGTGKEYLYSRISQYESLNEALWICFDDIGNGDFQSVRGLGTEAYNFGQTQDRLNNALVMNAMVGSTPLFQADSAEAVDKLAQVEVGPFRVIPSGLTLQQMNTGAGVNAALTVSQHFSMMDASQNGAYRSQALAPRGVERSAKEVSVEVANSSKLSNTKVAFYLLQLDRLIHQVYRRLIRKWILDSDPGAEIAKAFQKDLEKLGIPREAIESFKAKVTRPVGNGSEADRIQRLDKIGQNIGDMPERKRKVFVRDMIAYAGGSRELADRYGPDLEPQGPSVQEKLAMFENTSMAQGADPGQFFSKDDPHAVHFEVHRDFITDLLQSGEDPQAIAEAVENIGPHMAAHLKGLEGDPTRKTILVQYKQEFSEIMKAADQVMQQAETLADTEQPQNMDPTMMKTQADIALKTQKAQNDMAIKDAKARQQMALKDASTANNLRNQNARTKANQTQAITQTEAA